MRLCSATYFTSDREKSVFKPIFKMGEPALPKLFKSVVWMKRWEYGVLGYLGD